MAPSKPPKKEPTSEPVVPAEPPRRRLPDERATIGRKLTIKVKALDGSIEDLDIYVHVGLYPDGKPGEIFLKIGKQGTTLSGFADALATAWSVALQYGVPLQAITKKFRYMRFEPMGATGDPQVPIASSIIDLVAAWLELRFGTK